MRRLRFALPLALSVLFLDCTTKELAVRTLAPEHTPHAVAGNLLRFTLAYNREAAMSMPIGDHGRWPLVAVGVVIVAVLLRTLWRTPSGSTWRRAALGLLIGGALGNLISRVQNPRGVVDFIDIGVGSWRFFLFNVADIAVCTGAFILALTIWLESKPSSRTPWFQPR
ncbi:MAG TPA: signal peptidase II [Gemmatimonadales bacterium]|jgi:signal peptidase II|nr:signal peptidase II [Gemmatimonadales bacterium]